MRCALLDALRRQPGGERLLIAAGDASRSEDGGGVYLVGGAVRDLLRGESPRELDVVVEGEIGPLLGALGGDRVVHDRFGTATVASDGARIDVARARRERYPAPGALPEVEPASLTEDLLRRDFTVNALAIALDGPHRGALHEAPHALADLRAERLRVLHDRSFRDDPTRLWRLARYRARLGFEIEAHTARLAADAVAAGYPQTVSSARVGAELRLALAEAGAPAALAELDRLGLLAAVHPRVRFEQPLAQRSLALLRGAGSPNDDDRPDLLLLATLVLPLALRAREDPRAEIVALLDRLEFGAAERDRVAAAAVASPHLVGELPLVTSPSRLRELVLRVPPEGVALAGAVSEPAAAAARRWLHELREVRLRITGSDLLAAGVPEGPQIGQLLESTLRMRLDGELPDERGPQLRAALGSPPVRQTTADRGLP